MRTENRKLGTENCSWWTPAPVPKLRLASKGPRFASKRADANLGKPITLISGSELLYLLNKHGHKARIDLKEARLLAAEAETLSHRPVQ